MGMMIMDCEKEGGVSRMERACERAGAFAKKGARSTSGSCHLCTSVITWMTRVGFKHCQRHIADNKHCLEMRKKYCVD